MKQGVSSATVRGKRLWESRPVCDSCEWLHLALGRKLQVFNGKMTFLEEIAAPCANSLGIAP